MQVLKENNIFVFFIGKRRVKNKLKVALEL